MMTTDEKVDAIRTVYDWPLTALMARWMTDDCEYEAKVIDELIGHLQTRRQKAIDKVEKGKK